MSAREVDAEQVERLLLPACSQRPRWRPLDGELRFSGRAWVQVGQDDTVQVGPFLSMGRREAKAFAASAALPIPGDVVRAGLPMLHWIDPDGQPRCVAAPLTGRVLDVNWAIGEEVLDLGRQPVERAWLARLQPSLNPRDLAACRPREIWLLAAPPQQGRWRERLRRFGYLVRTVEDAGALCARLRDGERRVALVVASKLPEALTRRRTTALGDRVRICAVDPVEQTDRLLEQMGVDACLRAASSGRHWLNTLSDLYGSDECRLEPVRALAQPEWRQRVSIENVRGRVASVLIDRSSLRAHPGLLQGLIRQFSGRGFIPVVSSGPAVLDRRAVMAALDRADAVLILRELDTGRCPGALTIRRFTGRWNLSAFQDRLMDAILQPAPQGPPAWQFDPHTDACLAGHVAAGLFEL